MWAETRERTLWRTKLTPKILRMSGSLTTEQRHRVDSGMALWLMRHTHGIVRPSLRDTLPKKRTPHRAQSQVFDQACTKRRYDSNINRHFTAGGLLIRPNSHWFTSQRVDHLRTITSWVRSWDCDEPRMHLFRVEILGPVRILFKLLARTMTQEFVVSHL